MKITALQLENVRGFQMTEAIKASENINVFIGPNNAGKSTILNSIFLMQREVLTSNDITIGEKEGKVSINFTGGHMPRIPEKSPFNKIEITLSNLKRQLATERSKTNFGTFSQEEPHNLIYPYLSKRKAVSYAETINEQNANSVLGNFKNLYSKIDRLVTPQFQPGNKEYVQACQDILGFEISTLAKGEGKQAVLYIHNLEHIPLTAMGEGVANILGLITDLCVADERIFLIEEPENDIHPKALKALLNLIAVKSSKNQFFISTHSNIVMKYLGAVEESKIFNVTNFIPDTDRANLKYSIIKEVPQSPVERKKILEELGYDFFDHDLWKAWLFLEESSAEVIIRDHLIRWFTPKLKYELRTFSAGSLSKIQPKFDDFNKLFVFLHLEPTYKNKVWVYIDSGKEENMIIEKMKSSYTQSGWNESQFNQFSKHDFEEFYPKRFKKKVKAVLEIEHKQEKRTGKRELLEEVKQWINQNDKQAKDEFKESAKEIIIALKSILSKLKTD